MGDLQHISTETLKIKRTNLFLEIEEAEKALTTTKSYLFQLSLTTFIKRTKAKIHKIEAELAYRNTLDF